MTKERFSSLLQSYYEDKLADSELQEFLEAALDPAYGPLVQDFIDKGLESGLFKGAATGGQAARVFSRIVIYKDQPTVTPVLWYRRTIIMKWAVAVAVILTACLVWLLPLHKNQPPVVAGQPPADPLFIAPGGKRAVLTLADGNTLSLDSSTAGLNLRQGAALVKAESPGLLSYSQDGNQPAVRNTITTPRGGTFGLRLPDGSMAWLNAASSITYPTTFGKGPRKVQVEGEAFFKVASDPAHPFTVTVGSSEITVLGTIFNINAYRDAPGQTTTLLEGKVEVTQAGRSRQLAPGQQITIGGPDSWNIRPADTSAVVAWKNGMFDFRSTDLETIMRSIAKWYDIEVVFKDGMGSRQFTGKFSRADDASTMLHIMEESDIHLQLKGKILTISR